MDRHNSRKPHDAAGGADREPPRSSHGGTEEVWVRLTRKYAEVIDGVNLEHATVGDRLELSQREAQMLIAEGWAEPSEEKPSRLVSRRSNAADRHPRPKKKPRS